MAFNSVTITFTNDWIETDKLSFRTSLESKVFTWVATRSTSYEVTTGTPTATAGETAAINFKAAFDLDLPNYTTSISSNAITIESTTEGELLFLIYAGYFNTGTIDVSFNNIVSYDVDKINIRSPYFINVTSDDLTKCVVDIDVYTGTQVTSISATPTYSLEIDAYNDVVSFDLSQLVSDYLDVSFDGSFNSHVVWVNYRITEYINDTAQTPQNVINLVAFDGYGYFEDGVNPTLSKRVLQSNSTIYAYDNNYFYFPVQQNELVKVELLLSNGSVLSTQTFTPTNDSSDVIRYIGYTNESICSDIAVNYFFEDNDNYLFQDANNFIFSDAGGYATSIRISYINATTETINIKTITENKYTPYRLTFVNKFGALQSVWMFKRSDVALSVESESHRGFLYNSGNYNVSEHQYKSFNVTGKETISLNSGFYNEDYNEIFRQMVLSERIWIDYEGNLLPVNIKSKELSFKTQLNDKLINYKINFDFAFDKINSVY